MISRRALAIVFVLIAQSFSQAHPVAAAGASTLRDQDDSRSALDIQKTKFRIASGIVKGEMLMYDKWNAQDIKRVNNAGDRNMYVDLDFDGDFELDGYMGIYRKKNHLVALVRGPTASGQVGPLLGSGTAEREGRAVVFSFEASLIGNPAERIHYYFRASDFVSKGCRTQRGCYDQAPNKRWKGYET